MPAISLSQMAGVSILFLHSQHILYFAASCDLAQCLRSVNHFYGITVQLLTSVLRLPGLGDPGFQG